MKVLKIIILSLLLVFSAQVFALDKKGPSEELIIVQAVSKDKISFVVSKGIKDGIQKGQEVIFANENASIVCRAVEVNRNYSMWKPADTRIMVPFTKEDIISYNTHAYGNVALDIASDINRLTPKTNYNEVFKKFRIQDNYSFKISYDSGLAQSSSDVSTDKNTKRSGYTFDIEYNHRFMKEFEMSGGLRIENEVYRLSSPQLDIPTSRVIATLAATYHFVNFSDSESNFYISLATGMGTSKTTINEEVSSGYVSLLPEVRVGYLMPFSKTLALLFESSVDSIVSKETLSNGTSQTTNMLNMKFSLGLRF